MTYHCICLGYLQHFCSFDAVEEVQWVAKESRLRWAIRATRQLEGTAAGKEV